MRFVIVTGLSGAGKTQAIRSLEDIGYFCVDNLPPTLIPKFAEACFQSDVKIEKIALVIDIRGGLFFDDLFESLNYIKSQNYGYEILYLEASDEVLIKRYKESRRKHPLSPEGRVLDGILLEKTKLKAVRDISNNIIDTTNLSARELREDIEKIYVEEGQLESRLSISILSFGFKYGIPVDSDLVMDVRFLPNPFYIKELKPKSGKDKDVRDYVFSFKQTTDFVDKYEDLLEFLIPNYLREGKKQLIVSIGCTGGRHRSVAIAEELYKRLSENGHRANIYHRDINEDINRKGEKKL